MLEARFVFLKKIKRQQALAAGLPRPGPGRVDAFANARLFLFADADARPPSAPVRYPAIWALDNRHWVHWDGNTNSIAERNAGQAAAPYGAIARWRHNLAFTVDSGPWSGTIAQNYQPVLAAHGEPPPVEE